MSPLDFSPFNRLVAIPVFATFVCAVAPLRAGPVEFTMDEGYLNGSLSNQPALDPKWKMVGGATSFFVDSSGDGEVLMQSSQTTSQYAIWQPVVDLSQTPIASTAIDFSFVQNQTPAAATVFGMTFFTGSISGNSNVRAYLSRMGGADQYRIGFYQNNGTPSSVTLNVSGTSIGLNSAGGDNTSDQLQFGYTLTRGGNAAAWTAKVTLKNLTTSAVVGEVNVPAFSTTAAFFADNSLYAAISSEAIQNGNLAGFTIKSYSPPGDASLPALPGRTLTFNDEFNGASLDPAKWAPHYCKPATINSELQAYLPDNFEFSGTSVRIRSDNRVFGGKNYTSGAMTTYGRFAQTYGYFEMRVKVPEGRGLWPALWLLPQSQAWPPEIDIMELLGQDPRTVHQTLHYNDPALVTGSNPSGKTASGKATTGPDFSYDYHTFALSWRPEALIFYVDGVEKHRITNFVPSTPMYILANTAVGGVWPVPPDFTTPFPSYFDIDYIRAYRYDDLPTVAPLPMTFGRTTITPQTVNPGDTITVTSEAVIGDADIARLSLHMLVKNYWGTTQYSDTYQFMNNLVRNTTNPFTFTYTVPSNLPAGLYTVGFTMTNTATSTLTSIGLASRFTVGSPLPPLPPTPTPVSSTPLNLESFTWNSVSGQGMATHSFAEDGKAMRIQGNGWKVTDFAYTVTPNTWLEFDISAASIGEVYGLGFLPTAAYDNTTLNTYAFQISGNQNLGRQQYNTYSIVTGGSKHYKIPLGKFYTGPTSKLLFINDMDAAPTGDVTFKNIRIYEQP